MLDAGGTEEAFSIVSGCREDAVEFELHGRALRLGHTQYTSPTTQTTRRSLATGSGTKIGLIVELVSTVQMVRSETGGLVGFATLDRFENLAVLRQGQLLETGLANKIKVELGKPGE